VTGLVFSHGLTIGISGAISETLASSEIFPCSLSFMTANPTKHLVIETMRNMVSASAIFPVARSALPTPPAQITLSFETNAMPAPGT